ncbi:MAG: nucleotidyltransferase family protein [FCB group bacterium]|nr:nucleotidyltransferase family protein [FCB group bacterium]
MTQSEQIKITLNSSLPELRKKYPIKSIGLFGSYVRGEQKKRSDVDILVDFDETISLFKFVDLETELSDILGRKVDLVMKSALKPKIGERILEELAYI